MYYGDRIIQLIKHNTMESLRDGIKLEEEYNLSILENPTPMRIAMEKRKTSHMKMESARLLMIRSRNLYQSNKPLKWVSLFVGIVFAYVAGFLVIPKLTHLY